MRSIARERPRSPRSRPRLLSTGRETRGEPCRSRPTRRPSPSTSGTCPSATTSPQDVCDKHPAGQARDDPRALRRHGPRGALGRAAGALEPLRQRAARARRRRRATASRCCCRRRPRPPRRSSARGSAGAILLSMSVLYGDDGIRHRVSDSQAKVLVTNAANADRVDPALVEHVLLLDDELLASGDADVRARGHARRRPRAALLHERHDRAGQGHRPRAPLPARARGVRLLPRRAGRRALPRHGRVGVGGGHRAAARAVALRRRPARLPARGRLRPAQAARLPLAPRGHERLHDADGDALDDVDRRRGDALPAAVPRSSAAPASR